MSYTEKKGKSANNSNRNAAPTGAKSGKQTITVTVSETTAAFLGCLAALEVLKDLVFSTYRDYYKQHPKKPDKLEKDLEPLGDSFIEIRSLIELRLTESIDEHLVWSDKKTI